jgi:hypothetical protein
LTFVYSAGAASVSFTSSDCSKMTDALLDYSLIIFHDA